MSFDTQHHLGLAEPHGGLALWLKSYVKLMMDVILPPICLSCQCPVADHGLLCASCWVKIDFIDAPLCHRLGLPLPYYVGDKVVSAAALATPPAYHRARAVAAYDDVMRNLVHDLKYRDHHTGLALFSNWMVHAGKSLIQDADIVIPVPLNRFRLLYRRFNQSAQLAKAIARRTDLPWDPQVLVRRRRTRSQVGLTPRQRRQNVAGAFHIPARKRAVIAGKTVLLIDDVITTGATVESCTKALLGASAAQVDVLALARVTDPLIPDV